jgi:hypothetical protein
MLTLALSACSLAVSLHQVPCVTRCCCACRFRRSQPSYHTPVPYGADQPDHLATARGYVAQGAFGDGVSGGLLLIQLLGYLGI